MKPTEPLQEQLYREMVGRIEETDETPPVRRGEYLYYSRTEQGKQYETALPPPRQHGTRPRRSCST